MVDSAPRSPLWSDVSYTSYPAKPFGGSWSNERHSLQHMCLKIQLSSLHEFVAFTIVRRDS